MKLTSFDFLQAAAVRRAVVPTGDIREDIAFQNDINGLLARFDAKTPPLTALGWIQEPVVPSAIARAEADPARRTMRVIKGGLGFRAINDVTEPNNPPPIAVAASAVAAARRG